MFLQHSLSKYSLYQVLNTGIKHVKKWNKNWEDIAKQLGNLLKLKCELCAHELLNCVILYVWVKSPAIRWNGNVIYNWQHTACCLEHITLLFFPMEMRLKVKVQSLKSHIYNHIQGASTCTWCAIGTHAFTSHSPSTVQGLYNTHMAVHVCKQLEPWGYILILDQLMQ